MEFYALYIENIDGKLQNFKQIILSFCGIYFDEPNNFKYKQTCHSKYNFYIHILTSHTYYKLSKVYGIIKIEFNMLMFSYV